MTDLGPPFIPIDGVANFRDLGGTPVASPSGHTTTTTTTTTTSATASSIIRPGLVYRAAEPSRITDAGIAACTARRIAHVYDLRSAVEITRHAAVPRADWPPRRVFLPLFRDEDYSPEAIALRFVHYTGEGSAGFVEAYRTILEAGAGDGREGDSSPFGTILTNLAQPDPEPVLIHCTAGKDRTGVICAVILALCGVDDATIAAEYALTERGLGDFGGAIGAALAKYPSLRDNPEGVERIMSAKPENMLAALKMLREIYGSAEKYVVERCGISPEGVAQIRKNLIVSSDTSG